MRSVCFLPVVLFSRKFSPKATASNQVTLNAAAACVLKRKKGKIKVVLAGFGTWVYGIDAARRAESIPRNPDFKHDPLGNVMVKKL